MQELFFSQKTTKFSLPFLWAIMLAVVAGCTGTSGSSATTTPPPATGSGIAATIQLSASLTQISSTSTSTSVLTAIVLDGTGQAITGKLVQFSVGTDPTAYFTGGTAAATTDVNGIATATLNLGSNMTNRIIAVSATADSAIGSATVTVVGTAITITGNATLSTGGSTALTVSVKNSAGVAVPGTTLTVASANGNTIVTAPTTRITDANGQIVVTVTAISAATPDTITLTGAGATQTQALAITATATSFAFTAPITIVPPATTPEIQVNTPTTVSILWTSNGVPQAGQPVNFYSTLGTIVGNPATTNAAGVASVSLSAISTGAAKISAVGPGNTPIASLNIVFVTNTATAITAQANPGTINVNIGTSTANQSVISVVVKDAAGNLVKNANVAFNLTQNPSGGSLSSPIGFTDIAGTASVNYIAGSISSGVNQVIVAATVDSINGVPIAPVTTTTVLTVAGQTYFVRIETDNTVSASGAQYVKRYYALVTDAAGHAVTNAPVGFTLRPRTPPAVSFAKGQYVSTLAGWMQNVSKTCVSEDLNLNGIRDYIGLANDEDLNGNGQLDPYGVAVVNATANTDATGYAIATITYSKNYAYWVQLDLEARTLVSGNDPPAVVAVTLPGLASDYGSTAIAPPGQYSPFGVGSLCTDAL